MIADGRLLGLSLLLCLSFGHVACGDTEGEDGGEGGRDGATTQASSGSGTPASQTSSTADTSATTATTATDAASSSATVMPMPCVPPGVTGMMPTPGVCDGNTAVVCDGATSTIVERPCAANEACKVYPLTEHTFDGVDTITWVETGTVEWAACLPVDAAPCDMVFDGNNWASEMYAPQCVDDDRTFCGIPPVPEAPPGNGQKKYGAPVGLVHVVACPAGDVCREPLDGPVLYFDWLKCFDAAAAPCTVASSACNADTMVTCEASYGYETRYDCAPDGDVCMTGCDSILGTPIGRCTAPGTQSCDPQNPPATCDTQDAYTSCYECLTSPVDCSVITSIDINGNIVMSPGDCVVANNKPRCVAEGTMLCDVAAPETCAGNVAQRCFDGVVYETPCVGGDVCRVGSTGKAGCTFPAAEACALDAPRSCSGSEIHGCCPAEATLSPFVSYPCAPGFEAVLDCTDISANFTCTAFGPFVECNIP